MENILNAINENFLTPPGSYFFLLLGAVVLFFIIAFIVSKLWSGLFWYFRFRERNRDMEVLAKEFNLSFQSGISSFYQFILKSIFSNVQINDLKGSLGNHSIEIQDMFYSLTTLITWVAPRGLEGGNRQTIVALDGKQQSQGFSLGNPVMLTTIDELREFLKKQASV